MEKKEGNLRPMHSAYFDSPIGRLRLEDDGEALTALYLDEGICWKDSADPDEESCRNGNSRQALDAGCRESAELQRHTCEENSELRRQTCRESSELLRHTCDELREYFAGTRKMFDIPLHPQGTEFQKKVWQALREIPYGETRSYADIAERIGQPQACRAVGGANNRNRILILIPCHRVIGKNGSLTGFACGVKAKEYLLKLEQRQISLVQTEPEQRRVELGRKEPEKMTIVLRNVESEEAQCEKYGEERNGSVQNTVLANEASADYKYEDVRNGKYTLRDYYALPDEQRTELIDGTLYDMAAPNTAHQIAVMQISMQFETFIQSQKGSCCTIPSPIDVQLDCDERTMVQPDVVIICDKDKIRKRCVYGAPDLVVEVLSDSTFRRDLVVKLRKYIAAGVREYWIVDLKQETVIVYDIEHGCSTRIYGMNLPVPAEIFDRKCQIRFDAICERVRPILDLPEGASVPERSSY